MCFNSIFFFYNYLFFTNYLFISKFFLNKSRSIHIFLKKYVKQKNIYSLYKIFIVNNFSRVYLHKNSTFSSNNSLLKSVVLVSRLFRVIDYRRFYSFFFLNFLNKLDVLFFSFKLFFFEFLTFMSYIHGTGFFLLFKPLYAYYQEKKNRKKFFSLIIMIFSKYKPKSIILFDYKYSSFFLKVLKMSSALIVGFKYLDTDVSHYHYYLLLGDKDVLVKYAVFQQIFDIYSIAMYVQCVYLSKRFLILHKYFN